MTELEEYPVLLFGCGRHYFFEAIDWDVYSKYPKARPYIETCVKAFREQVKENGGYWPDEFHLPGSMNKVQERAQLFWVKEIDKRRTLEEKEIDKKIEELAAKEGVDISVFRQLMNDEWVKDKKKKRQAIIRAAKRKAAKVADQPQG